MNYKVEKKGDSYYIMGLPDNGNPFEVRPDTLLLYHYNSSESETPDVDSPNNAKKMLGCLYDEFQCNDGLKDGDTFETPFGNFVCQGVHVIPAS